MKSNWFCKYKIAHRGLHNKEFPENSLPAFQNAINYDFAIELDVQLTKDNVVVVFHDKNIYRMCGKNTLIENEYYDNLKSYKLNNTPYYIPTLQEVLNLVNSKVPIMIELKLEKRYRKFEEKVYNIIKDYTGDIAIKSFNPFSVLWFKRNAPNIPRGLLSSFFDEIPINIIHKTAIKKLWFLKIVKPNFISYNYKNLPNKYTDKLNIPILAWTIESKESEENILKVANNIIFQNYIPEKNTNY